MRAILLAAGVGSRISREIDRPKSLLEVYGSEPLIVYTIKMLQGMGIEVAVVLGYRKEMFYEKLNGLNVRFYENPFFRVTNSLGSLWFARDFMQEDEDFLVMNADVFAEREIFERILEAKDDVSLLSDYRTVKSGDYFFKLENGCICKYGKSEMPEEDRDCEYVGIVKVGKGYINDFKRELTRMVDAEEYNKWWENVLYDQCDNVKLKVLDVAPYFWSEIDYIEDYEKIKNYIANSSAK